MVLAIEMGVVFVLLTAILMALYVAWQNAKFVGDRLRKKQVMKRLVAGGAVIMVLLLTVGTAVPALAAPTADMLVVDNANMLTAGEQLDIENMLLDINRQTGIEYFG